MTAVGVSIDPSSPFTQAAPGLIALGYHPLPIMPSQKRPGVYISGDWQGMKDWQRHAGKAPSRVELNLWNAFPAANVGLVMGSPAGPGLFVGAIDVDAQDYDDVNALVRALPRSPMIKRGRKGQTLFFRMPKTITSHPYNRATDRQRLVDVLTGFDARQTVVPPSIHPETGAPYQWLGEPVRPEQLPVFDEDALAVLEETLQTLGWDPERERQLHSLPTRRPVPATVDEDDFFTETKRVALDRLDDWVPALDLYGCRRARGGYEAVASWRPSMTGRALEQRKRNLSIQCVGITDFGDGPRGYSAIDLVMAAQNVDQAAATSWLRERLSLDDKSIVIALQPREVSPEPISVAFKSHGNSPQQPAELPDALTRVPGLLGEVTDWIADTARRPQRGLALGAALTVLGTAAGRKYAGPTRTGTHLYVLGLARTSAGKDHAIAQIPRLLTSAGLAQHIGPAQFMSLPAVIKRLGRSGGCFVCPMDEMGSFLARINNRRSSPFEQAITGILRTVWGASFQTVMPPEWAGHEADPIHAPAVSIYGVSTHDEFYKALGGADISNGFLNRFLLISTTKKPPDREPKADPFAVPEVIRHGLRRVYGSGLVLVTSTSHNGQADGPSVTATWDSPAAHEVYVEFGRTIEEREEEAPLIGRTVEIAQRLATIRALGVRHDAPRITVEDMEWGRDVALWSAERMIAETMDHIADTQNQAEAQMIMRAIRERGRIKHGDLLLVMRHRLKAKDFKDVIQGLLDAGQVIAEKVVPPAGGTTTTYYTAV